MRRLLVPLLVLLAACTHSTPRPPEFDDPDAATAFSAAKRGIAASTNVHALYAAARAHLAHMPNTHAEVSTGTWTFLGPGNIGGRTRALLIDPNAPDVLYAGAVSGGVWKSTNGGASWSPVGDVLTNLAVCTLAFEPGDSRTIYAGTGEGYFREDVRGTALPIAGDGIFVSHDAGASWHHFESTAGNPDFQWVNKLAVTARGLYAATRSGVWRSLDRGATWSRVLPTAVKGGCLDLALTGTAGGDALLASCGIFEQAAVYRSAAADTDAAWTQVLTDPSMGRTTLAVAASNPDVVYALAACNNDRAGGCHDQGLLGVYRSDRAGAAGSWHVQASYRDADRVTQTLLSNRTGAMADVCHRGASSWTNMGWHCNVIAVDPTNPDRVWAGGVDLFRSDDAGRTWGEASFWELDDSYPQFVHADQHVIAFDPRYDGASNRTMLFATDGGMYRTDNALDQVAQGPTGPCNLKNTLVRFTTLNHSYGVTQFYSGAVLPDGSRWFGGAQDNGTIIGDRPSGIDGWQPIFGGDGGTVAIDPANPQTIYVQYQWGMLFRSDDGGRRFTQINNGTAANYLFVTPYLVDPNDHRRVFLGGTQVQRSTTFGSGWGAASAPLADGAMVSALAATPSRSGFVLAGTTSGEILRSTTATTDNASTVWASSKPRDGFVSSIAIDPANPDTAYATYALFGGGPHVWRTLDGGTTWSPLDGTGDASVPDIPVHTVVLDGARLFLGTDLGILSSTDAGTTWRVESAFPAVITEALVIAPGTNGPALYAFTHGRGAWRAELVAPLRRRATR